MDMRDRFNKAFAYLQGEQIIKGQKDLAEKLGATPGNISKALSGDKRALTNNLMKRFCEAFPGMFNLRWLILGEGNMLQAPVVTQEPMKPVEVGDDKDETIKGLRSENMALINTINKLIDELAAMRGEINAIKAHINIQTYHVASGDVNPAALNDELKKYR